MKAILSFLLTQTAANLAKLLENAFLAAREAFKYLNGCRQDKIAEKRNAEAKDWNARAREACDNGNLEDVLNL